MLYKWSEMSDVVYCYTRAKWDNCNVEFPLKWYHFALGTIYMFPKYNLRWYFFRRAGRKIGSKKELHEVRNPRKTHKLHHIAGKYDVDAEKLQKICEEQLKHWILLP
jgi:hypothetical protein